MLNRCAYLAILTVLIAPVAFAANDLIDPTRPSGAPAASATSSSAAPNASLNLTFIRLGNAPLAVINGRNIRPGEKIAGYRLLSLQAGSATLDGANGKLVLKLHPSLNKYSVIRRS